MGKEEKKKSCIRCEENLTDSLIELGEIEEKQKIIYYCQYCFAIWYESLSTGEYTRHGCI